MPNPIPVTHAQGHQERSPLCSAGTMSVTTSARTHRAVPTTAMLVADSVTLDTGADGPKGVVAPVSPTVCAGAGAGAGAGVWGVSGSLTGTA